MKIVKRITALIMVAVLSLSLVGCIHKKNEIAVTIGDTEFTSAYYMCALVNANMEAKQKVNEMLTADEQKEDINYYSKKIDKKSYVDWVEDRAIEILKEIATFKALCAENKVKLTAELKTEAEQNVATMWDYYGYSAYYEPNGVSRDTFLKFTEDNFYSEAYFMSVYGKGGTKEIAEDKVAKEITDSYIIVDKISINYDQDYAKKDKETQKAEATETLNGYVNLIKSGKKTFVDIYKEHYDLTNEETTTNEEKPVNTYAAIVGKEGTSFEDNNYKTYKKYEVNEPKVEENSDATGMDLVIKRDITTDKYFMDYLDDFARHSIADEDYDKEIQEYAKKLKAEINNYAVNQFKVKNIVEPEAN